METFDLSELFNTKSQAQDFSSRMAIVVKKVFETGFTPEGALLEQFGVAKKDAFMTILRNNGVNAESRLAIKTFIDKIQEHISALPTISLTLAFEPTEKTLQGLSRWFILNIKKQVLFDITVDTKLIGGAVISSGGRFLDYSIKPDFERIFRETFGPKPLAPIIPDPKSTSPTN